MKTLYSVYCANKEIQQKIIVEELDKNYIENFIIIDRSIVLICVFKKDLEAAKNIVYELIKLNIV